jgi:hypothetical protein
MTMSQQSKNAIGLVLLIVVILIALLFLTPAFRFSCSRVFMHDFLGMDHSLITPGLFYSVAGLERLIPLLIMFVLWGAVSVWVYHDAERRGHSGLLWGLFVFIGSIIGLIIYLILRVSSPESGPPALAAGTEKCPNCSRAIQKSFIACPYCGIGLADKCGGCGKNIEPDWQVCPYCGQAAGQTPPEGSIDLFLT